MTPLLINSFYANHGKRLCDMIGSVALIAAAIPFQFIVAVAIFASSGRPILFHQVRVGRHGKHFRIHKFRTMSVGTEQAYNNYPSKAAITSVGRLLRRLSLDEIPQLWNILRGEMSFVGPRPALPTQVAKYNDQQCERLLLRPGLTGLAQIRHRNNAPWSRRIESDLEYLDTLCLITDVRILLRTVPKALVGEGQVVGQTASDVDDLGTTQSSHEAS